MTKTERICGWASDWVKQYHKLPVHRDEIIEYIANEHDEYILETKTKDDLSSFQARKTFVARFINANNLTPFGLIPLDSQMNTVDPTQRTHAVYYTYDFENDVKDNIMPSTSDLDGILELLWEQTNEKKYTDHQRRLIDTAIFALQGV